MQGLREWFSHVAQHFADMGTESQPEHSPADERKEFAQEAGRVIGPQVDAYRKGLELELDDPQAAAQEAEQFRGARWRELWSNYDAAREQERVIAAERDAEPESEPETEPLPVLQPERRREREEDLEPEM